MWRLDKKHSQLVGDFWAPKFLISTAQGFYWFFFPKIHREFLLENSESCCCSKEFSWATALVMFRLLLAVFVIWFYLGFFFSKSGSKLWEAKKEGKLNSHGISLLDQVHMSILPADECRWTLTFSSQISEGSVGAGKCFVLRLYNHNYLTSNSKAWLWRSRDLRSWGSGLLFHHQ